MRDVLARLEGINLSSADGWFFVRGTGDGLPRSAERAPGRPASAPPLPGTAAPLRSASSPKQLSGYGKGDSDSPLLSLDEERSLKGREGKKGEREPRGGEGTPVRLGGSRT